MRSKRIAALALAIAASAPWVCTAQTVTFDDVVPDFPGSSISNCFSSAPVFVATQGPCADRLATRGYTLTTATGESAPFAYLSPSRPDLSPTNGTAALFVDSVTAAQQDYLSISRSDGALLSLQSFDFAELNAFVNFEPYALLITGVYDNGTTVSQSFVFDRAHDGSGPLADYQRAAVPSSFQDLVEARFQVIADPLCTGECFAPADFSIDNLALTTVAAIPEPSSAALMILPLAMLAALARRRRQRQSQKM
jgi:MYXO-CTERM domain-containing protein